MWSQHFEYIKRSFIVIHDIIYSKTCQLLTKIVLYNILNVPGKLLEKNVKKLLENPDEGVRTLFSRDASSRFKASKMRVC